jgi:hypothetical protein
MGWLKLQKRRASFLFFLLLTAVTLSPGSAQANYPWHRTVESTTREVSSRACEQLNNTTVYPRPPFPFAIGYGTPIRLENRWATMTEAQFRSITGGRPEGSRRIHRHELRSNERASLTGIFESNAQPLSIPAIVDLQVDVGGFFFGKVLAAVADRLSAGFTVFDYVMALPATTVYDNNVLAFLLNFPGYLDREISIRRDGSNFWIHYDIVWSTTIGQRPARLLICSSAFPANIVREPPTQARMCIGADIEGRSVRLPSLGRHFDMAMEGLTGGAADTEMCRDLTSRDAARATRTLLPPGQPSTVDPAQLLSRPLKEAHAAARPAVVGTEAQQWLPL